MRRVYVVFVLTAVAGAVRDDRRASIPRRIHIGRRMPGINRRAHVAVLAFDTVKHTVGASAPSFEISIA